MYSIYSLYSIISVQCTIIFVHFLVWFYFVQFSFLYVQKQGIQRKKLYNVQLLTTFGCKLCTLYRFSLYILFCYGFTNKLIFFCKGPSAYTSVQTRRLLAGKQNLTKMTRREKPTRAAQHSNVCAVTVFRRLLTPLRNHHTVAAQIQCHNTVLLFTEWEPDLRESNNAHLKGPRRQNNTVIGSSMLAVGTAYLLLNTQRRHRCASNVRCVLPARPCETMRAENLERGAHDNKYCQYVVVYK